MNQSHNICRLCTSNTNVRHDILKNSILINTKVICLEEILYSTIGIKVFEEDGLSTAICDECTNQITNFFVFKRKIEDNEDIDEDMDDPISESDISSQKEADAVNGLLNKVTKFVMKNKIFRLDLFESNKKLEIIRTKSFNCPICSARFPNKSVFEEHFIACEIVTSTEITITPDENVESTPSPAENCADEEEEDCIYEDYLELDNYSEKLETEEIEIEIENQDLKNESTNLGNEKEPNQFLIRDFNDSNETQDQLIEETDESNSLHKDEEMSPTKTFNSFIQIPNRNEKYKTKIVNKTVTYICSNCDKSFQSQSGLNSHIRLSCSRNIGDRTEEQILLFTCKNCLTVSCTTSQHFKHLSKCKGKDLNLKLQKEVLYCPKESCQQEFTDLRLLRQHATACCPSSIIARKFVRGKYNIKPKSQTTFHSVDHIKQTSYCNFCNKRFDDEFMRENHIEIHKAFEYLMDNELLVFNECEICHMVFSSKKDLVNHDEKACNQSSTVLECGSCGITFYQNEIKTLKQHVFFRHLSNFVCPVESCKVDLKTPRFYYFHIQMRHPNFLKIDTEFKCQYCGKCFENYPVLSSHRKKDCNAKSFKCNHCDKVYGSQSLLNAHIFKINNPFICSICNKSCKDSSQLKIHMRTHTKERPYKCNICNATFTTPGLRAAHADKHNSQKQFQCGLCKKEFQTKMNLTSHMKNHTGAVHCKFCGNLYASKKSLECHMRSHKNNKSEY